MARGLAPDPAEAYFDIAGAKKSFVSSRSAKFSVDVVHAKGNTITSARCAICRNQYRMDDATLRMQNLSDPVLDDVTMHRRCVEGLLANSVEDAPREKVKFEKYRGMLAERHGIEV